MITNQRNSASIYNDLDATDSEWAQEFFILHYGEIGGKKANAPSASKMPMDFFVVLPS